MANPTHTTRVVPTGIRIPEGFRSLLAFAKHPAINMWEKALKPMSTNGGEMIDITTQHNSRVHTKYPRKLIMNEDVSFEFAYDPSDRATIEDMVNDPDSCTFYFPDGSYEDFFGALIKVEFAELKEGEFPSGTATVGVMNYDPVNRLEVPPVRVSVAGT